jgi:hypothetical protein
VLGLQVRWRAGAWPSGPDLQVFLNILFIPLVIYVYITPFQGFYLYRPTSFKVLGGVSGRFSGLLQDTKLSFLSRVKRMGG